MARQVFRVFGAGLVLLFLLCGCGLSSAEPGNSESVASVPEPIAMQLLRASPDLKGHRFSNLLSFEDETDLVFLTNTRLLARRTPDRMHTGKASLELSGGPGRMTIKLTSLLGSQSPFPGEWALAGAYFSSDSPARITVVANLAAGSTRNTVTIAPGQRWTPVMVDLSAAQTAGDASQPSTGQAPAPTITFLIDSAAAVWCDDLVLIDNTQWLVGGPTASGTQPSETWSVRRQGMDIVCDAPQRFSIRLPAAEASTQGWRVQEANALRARFSAESARNRTLTICHDGRSFWDGEFRPLCSEFHADPNWAQQHLSPALIEIDPAMGRIDRRSPGDANNDGYNESRGCYRLIASGARLECTLVPRSAPLMRPMLEVAGLPPGQVLVSMEGRLVEQTIRLPDGTLLVELPGRIDRPTLLSLRVQ
ncbi:hypothetical protein [Fontivita pretiosa]|uniref:hypothetical protein n=1 Tax=Fontivita pretiosa TaxID=2989684 RepID=UPI003D167270